MISGCETAAAIPQRRMAIVTTIGGTLRFFSGMGEQLLERGWTTWAIADRDNHYDDVCRTERFHPCPVKLSRRIDPFRDLGAVWRLWWIFCRLNITSVHAHTPKAGLTSMIAAWLARVPIRTYTVHGMPLETSNGLRWILLWLADAVAFVCATNVYCVSPSVKAQLGRYRLPKAKSASVLGPGTVCGVDVDGRFNYSQSGAQITRDATRSKLGIPANAVVAGFVGRFVHDKGVAELIAAWERAQSVVPGLRMLVVGGIDEAGGPAYKDLNRIKSNPHWSLAGWVPDVETYLAAMDFLVLPSYREGFPTVVLEAGAMQIPSIVSNATGCIDSVEHNTSGLVVPVRDVVALSDAIEVYATDPDLRLAHGRNAHARVHEFFSRADVQRRLIGEYERLFRPLTHEQNRAKAPPLSPPNASGKRGLQPRSQ